VRTARYKARYLKGGPEGYHNALFTLGALVVISVVFFLGFQVGRVVERKAAEETLARKGRQQAKRDVRREPAGQTGDAVRIPVVTPPPPPPPPMDAGEELKKAEAAATFHESLTRKDDVPQPLVKPKPSADAAVKKRFVLQAGAMKTREAAETLKGRLEREGFRARVIQVQAKGQSKGLFRVRIGPYMSKEEAVKAMKEIRAALKIDVIIFQD
jgi:cell division protein FtsN